MPSTGEDGRWAVVPRGRRIESVLPTSNDAPAVDVVVPIRTFPRTSPKMIAPSVPLPAFEPGLKVMLPPLPFI